MKNAIKRLLQGIHDFIMEEAPPNQERPGITAQINRAAINGDSREVSRLMDVASKEAEERFAACYEPAFGSPAYVARATAEAQQALRGGKSGTVYVIKDLHTGLYKIGITTNMKRRMSQLGVGKSAVLVSQQYAANAAAVEKTAHRRYKYARLPQTEYFKLTGPPSI